TVERALDAGRRHRQAGKLLGSPLAVPIGKSRLMQQLRAELQQIAANPSPVLLVGEPGSGREAFARYLHEHGPGAAAPFVPLVASSLRDADAEGRLFGREEGGAQKGLLEEAANGTLFLHELEDLPAGVQRLLVGVLESGQFTRLGGAEPIKLRARLLSSGQPGIEQRAAAGSLRRDLLAHLNVLIMRVPPLRDYAEDVPDLLRHQVDRLVDADALPFRRFSVAAQNRLRNYPWPDNVRELRHLVHRLLIRGGTEEIRLEEIERELAVQTPPDEPLVKQDLLALPLREAREQFERAYLQQQLLLCNGKVGQLAKRVGMERTHLYRKLRSLGVDFRNISEE
ncbi:MAG TPA: sigma 54-interacting transcriptional regulator, partial [Steroidobacteraceae bacterium]|nr:sigma 54-interacting transcriptional regulator [Steroidobacteraceae bacterium]